MASLLAESGLDSFSSELFVSTVMAANVIEKVNQPGSEGRRKRPINEPSKHDNHNAKKLKNDGRQATTPIDETSVHDVLKIVQSIPDIISKSMAIFQAEILTKVEEAYSVKLKQVQDGLEKKIDELKVNVNNTTNSQGKDIDLLKTEVAKLHSVSSTVKEDISMNIVVRNLIESENENIIDRVNGLIRDGLSLRDVEVEEAERKRAADNRYPGLVVAKCKSKEDKSLIMKSKAKLKTSRLFEDVFINSDKTQEQRLYEANLRTIASVMDGKPLRVVGLRLERTDRPGNHNRRDVNNADGSGWERVEATRARRAGHNGRNVGHRVKFSTDNIPSDFLTSDQCKSELQDIIDTLESTNQEQSDLDTASNSLVHVIKAEMKNKLPHKSVLLDASSNKKRRSRKPWWTSELSDLWNKMCRAEKVWLKSKGKADSRANKDTFVSRRRQFDREVQTTKRKYIQQTLANLEKLCNSKDNNFWKEIGRVGVGAERRKQIPMIVKSEDGTVRRGKDEVLSAWKEHFTTLLNDDTTVEDGNGDENLSSNTVPLFNSDISLFEINKAIDNSHKGKACGVDDIPVEL